MKAILLLLLACVLGAFAQEAGTIVAKWAGDTSTSNLTFKAPVNSPCNQAANPTNYIAVNTTFTTAGVREVVLLAEDAFDSNVVVYLYSTQFVPTDSCGANFVRQLTNTNTFGGIGSDLIIDDPVYFAAGTTYIFVISSSSQGVNGKFVLQIWGSVGFGTTTTASPTWNPSQAQGSGCVVNTAVNQTVGIVQWIQASNGNFDLSGLFDVAAGTGAPSPAVYWTLYAGTFSAADIATNSCAITPAIGLAIRVNANEADRSVGALNIPLSLNQAYTVAISNAYNGNFAFNVFPTRLTKITSINGWTQPSLSPPCAASSNNNAPYSVLSVPASLVTGPFAIVDTQSLPTYLAPWFVNFDTRAFAYSGAVTGAPPAACPTGNTYLGSADTGSSPLTFSTTAGSAYSLIVSTYSGSPLTDGNSSFYLYAFTGSAIGSGGNASTTSTTAGTTGPTTGLTSSTGATGNTSTSATTGSGGATTTTSSASSVAFSVFLLFAIALALLL